MKIILTSTGCERDNVVNKLKRIINKPFENIKMLVIPTARKYEYNKEKYMQDYINLGFSKENVYFFDDDDADYYRNLDIDLIYVCGGNTFLLKKCLKKSNFEHEIKKYINNGVIYLGASAGTHLATENIEHVEYFDENEVKINDYEGLGFFDGIILCHYDETRKAVYEILKENSKFKIDTLTNDEMLFYENGKWTKE